MVYGLHWVTFIKVLAIYPSHRDPTVHEMMFVWSAQGAGIQVERGCGGVFLLEVQYSILKSLISTCVLSYVGSREDWLLDRICESKKDCWDSIRRTSYPYQ